MLVVPEEETNNQCVCLCLCILWSGFSSDVWTMNFILFFCLQILHIEIHYNYCTKLQPEISQSLSLL